MMTDTSSDLFSNATGDFSVNQDNCMAHGCCAHAAPANFELPADFHAARIFKQPETPAELDQCLNAVSCCPVNAIEYSGQDPNTQKRLSDSPA